MTAALYAAMLPDTPRTTVRPRRLPAKLRGAAGPFALERAREASDRARDILGVPRRGIEDDVIAGQVVEIDVIQTRIAPPLRGLAGLDIGARRLDRHRIAGGDAARAHVHRRAQPHADIAVDEPPAQPALDHDPAGLRLRDLGLVDHPVDRGVLFREPPQRAHRDAAAPGLVAEDLAARQITEAEGLRERARNGALARADLPAHRQDHSPACAARSRGMRGSAATASGSGSSSSTSAS